VLDGLAGLQGLADLLRSHKVGVRGLSRSLPEAADGLAETRAALRELEAVIGAEVDAVHARAALGPVESALGELQSELGRGGNALDARRRIALEVRIAAIVRDLEVAQSLADLFTACLDPRPIPLDLADLLRQRWPVADEPEKRGGRRDSSGVRRAVIDVPPGSTFTGDARAATVLLELAAGFVLDAGATTVLVTAKREGDRLVVRASEAQPSAIRPGATVLLVRTRAMAAGALGLAREAAARSGAELETEPSRAEATLTR
jgi:hypothetical protein